MKLTYQEFHSEVRNILDYWINHCIDREQGGFYGRIDGHNQLHPEADKGVVLNTRILWSFAAAGRILAAKEYRQTADRAYQYLLTHFLDNDQGGLFWMLDYQGNPQQTKKQIYAQAFGIYALVEYFQLTHETTAKELAVQLYHLIEKYSYDPQKGGYYEAFSSDWELLDDLRLSEKDANEKKTMNTHLHLLEAYTSLYRIWPDPTLRNRLTELTDLFLTRIIDPQSHHLGLFFDEHWNLKSPLISFGHDIEAAWLLTEAAEVLSVPEISRKVQEVTLSIAEVTLREGMDADGGLFNEAIAKQLTDSNKHWWPQAEALVGFYNAYQLSGSMRYYAASVRCWHFIQSSIIDPGQGEWRWGVTQYDLPMVTEDKVGPWKGPYHNTRACLEMMRRLK